MTFVTCWSTMHLTIFKILAFAFFISCSLARNSQSSLIERNPDVIANRSVPYGEHPVEMTKRDDTKFVFMHIIVGNTFSYTNANWISDIQLMQGKGVDALALNIGSDDWEPTQVANAYAAAKSLGTDFKLFLSFDFTAIGCSIPNLVSSVNQYANHPNQFKVDGKPMISSFEGECLGNTGWASLAAQTNGYNMPFISGLEGAFSEWPALNSWMCWGCAWPPNGITNVTTADDFYYLNQLGRRYVTTVSVWMFTHLSSKNFYQSGDDWLVNSRWEQLVSLRNNLTFVEMVTWNDFGESDYFGPLTGAGEEPWSINFPHIAWFDMSQYYITAFKTGSYPPISTDVVYFWARSHPANATASNDPLPRPTGTDTAEDSMWAVAFATSEASVTLQCGSSSSTFQVTPGVTKLKIPLAPGQMSVKMVRNGQTIIDETAQNFTFTTNPILYNFNAWVGSATASIANTGAPHTSASSISPSSSPSIITTSSLASPTGNITTLTTSTAIPATSSPQFTSNTSSARHTSTSSKTSTSSSLPTTITTTSAPTGNITTLTTRTLIPPTSSPRFTSNTSSTRHTSTSSKSSRSSLSTTASTSLASTVKITTLRTSTVIPATSSSWFTTSNTISTHTPTSSKSSTSSSLSTTITTSSSSVPTAKKITTLRTSSTAMPSTSSPSSWSTSSTASTHTSTSSKSSSPSSPSTATTITTPSVPTSKITTLETSTTIPWTISAWFTQVPQGC